MKKNPVVHFEMPYKNAKRVAKFYSTAFGWGMMDAGAKMGNYVVATTTETDKNMMVKTPGNINGGFFPRDPKQPGRNAPSVVIAVSGITKAIKDVKAAGGKIVGKPMDIPGVGRWVVFVDPEGNRVSLLQATN